MYATVEWWDQTGAHHSDGIAEPTSLDRVLRVIERQGGKISRYNTIPKAR